MSSDFKPPGFRILRCCGNCLFFRRNSAQSIKHGPGGWCSLEKQQNPDAKSFPSLATFVCDAHIFKTPDRTIHRLYRDYGAAAPDQLDL